MLQLYFRAVADFDHLCAHLHPDRGLLVVPTLTVLVNTVHIFIVMLFLSV